MVYTAFNIVPLVDPVQGKLESLDFWENNLYIGTSTGDLFLYHIEETQTQSGQKTVAGFLECQSRVGPKKPVEQISVVAELGKLIVLCDGNITIHDLNSLSMETTVPAAKGANLFCTNKYGPLYRMAVSIKKKLHLFEFIGEYVHVKDMMLPDSACALTWHNNNICVGYKREYTMMNDETGEVVELFSLDSRTSKPLIRVLPGEELLLGSDDLGVIMDFNALPTRSGIRWSNPPVGLGESRPYIVALQAKCIEVYNLFDQSLVQSVPFAGSVDLKDDGRKLLVASQNRVCMLDPVPFSMQIKELFSQQQVPEGLDLFERTHEDDADKAAKTLLVHEEAAFVYLCALQFDKANEHFLKTKMDPCELLCYFKDLLPASLEFQPRRRGHTPDIHAVVSAAVRKSKDSNNATEEDVLIGLHVEEAMVCCSKYVQWAREQEEHSKRLDVIDTALVKLYVQIGKQQEQQLSEFLAGDNHAVLADCEQFLKENRKYNALALMYKKEGLDVQALDMWEKLGSRELIEAGQNGVRETVVFLAEHTDHNIIWKYSKWVLEKDPEEGLKIFTAVGRENPLPPVKVVEYLSNFSDALYQSYLEHLIHVEKTTVSDFHTQLAMHYTDTVITLMPSESGSNRPKAGSEAGLLGQVRTKLLSFLDMSSLINFEMVIRRCDNTGLYEERVILFKKIREHVIALHILVYDLQDLDAAEAYCTTIDSALGTKEDCLIILLATLCAPRREFSQERKVDPAIKLAEKYAGELDPLRVMEIMPSDLPLQSFFLLQHRVLRKTHHKYRDGMIVKNVAKMENFQVKCDLVALRMGTVRITRDRNCPVCGKRISDKVFVSTPKQEVVHFKCFNENKEMFKFGTEEDLLNEKMLAVSK